MRAIAVDWSGAADPAAQRRAIWTAEAVDGSLRSLTAGRTRAQTVADVLRRVDADTVVGLDFGFSFPAWWVRRCGAADGPSMWEVALAEGERWLTACAPPFWGRSGRRRPAPSADEPEYRRTELAVPPGARRPKSVFQVGGAGSVGTGSIRGMPALRRMRQAGVAVWPFDPWPADGPVVVEAYPRWCTGPVVKSRAADRAAHLAAAWPRLTRRLAAVAGGGDDAFDAACTALVLSVSARPDVPVDAVDRLEGRVFASAQPPAART